MRDDELSQQLRDLASSGASRPFDSAAARRIGQRRRTYRQAGAGLAALALLGGAATGIAIWRPWDNQPLIVAGSPTPSATIATPTQPTPSATTATPSNSPTPTPTPTRTPAPTQTPTTAAPTSTPTRTSSTASAAATTAAGSTACLPDVGICFTVPTTVDVKDASQRTATGWTSNDLTFTVRGAGDVGRALASKPGGIGGACQKGQYGAIITKVSKTSLADLPVSAEQAAFHSTEAVVAQGVVQFAGGWVPITYVTQVLEAQQPGTIDACSLMNGNAVGLGSAFLTVDVDTDPWGPPSYMTQAQALAQLDTPTFQTAASIFATARRG